MAKIISYERRVYESVDDNSLSWAISQKTMKKERMQQRVKKEWILEKFPNKLCEYESVNNNSLFQVVSRKTTGERIWTTKG